jgi:hypothetical protein
LVAVTTRTLIVLVRPIGADAMNVAVLEEAQEQRLHAQAHLADLVEEDRAAVRLLEEPRLVAIGAGEAAAHVTEQLRFEQRVRHAGAIDRHERTRAARAVVVHQARDHFLADAALSGQENLRVGTRGLSQFVLDLPHLYADRDQRQRFVLRQASVRIMSAIKENSHQLDMTVTSLKRLLDDAPKVTILSEMVPLSSTIPHSRVKARANSL